MALSVAELCELMTHIKLGLPSSGCMVLCSLVLTAQGQHPGRIVV